MKTPSIEPIQKSRLLPRVSSRSLFLLTAIAAVLLAVARASGDGGEFASGVIVAVAFFGSCLAVFVLLFLFAWVVSLLAPGEAEPVAEGSPFAEDQLPPQILPPREPPS